jgi:hypothetical protein
MKGRQKSSWHHLSEDLFIAEPDQIYLFKRGEEWQAPEPFVFVRPIESEDRMFNETGGLEQLWGELVYKNDKLEEVEQGDIVSYTPDCEYEFKIDDEIQYADDDLGEDTEAEKYDDPENDMDLEDTNQYIADQTTEHSKKIEKILDKVAEDMANEDSESYQHILSN